jgi:Xaa-Pro dipeptidase
MHKAAVDALHAAEAALKPGRPIGEVFDAHAEVLDRAGYRECRMNATGYSLGTTFAPNWMDWPMFYHGNPVEAAPGMVFFIHIIVFDEKNGLAMTHGRTSEVTASGSAPLSKAALDFVVN